MRRRLFRIPLNAATAVSALLCVATLVLWLRPIEVSRRLEDHPYYREVTLSSAGGSLEIRLTEVSLLRVPPKVLIARRGWGWYDVTAASGYGERVRYRGVRCWAASALFLTLFGAGAWSWVRSRPTRQPGRCPACGYDLRATPDRCPECGTVPPPPA